MSRKMARVVFCIIPLLFGLGSCDTDINTLLTTVTESLSDALALTNTTFAALDFVGLAAQDGYSATEHTVTTDDGYILTIFRLTGNGCSSNSTRPVMLQHGVLLSADTWLDAGVNASLAYLLADDCYDLWVTNIRGNYYGRAHTTLDPDTDDAFWDFAEEEFGYYDLPAMIDYILDTTGYSSLNYIGHSQGGGCFFVMISERPAYNDKINLFIGLAPQSRLLHLESAPMKAIASSSALLTLLGQSEVYNKGSLLQTALVSLCYSAGDSTVVYEACENVMGILDAYHLDSMTAETTGKIYYHYPAGTSVKLLGYYNQLLTASTFNKYDYGSTENLELYGSATVPAYNLSAVTAPAVIMGGENDHVIELADINWAQSQLPRIRYS